MEHDSRRPLKLGRIILLVAAIVAAFAVYSWFQHRAAVRERQEQLAQTQGIARVLSATFSRQNKLQVGQVSGALDVTTVDAGLFEALRSSQRATLPYSVTYTLDLSGLTLEDFRWDPATRTLTVRAPDVSPGEPNIDESRRSIQRTSGLFVTREASANLSRRAAVLATQAAARKARSPEEMAKARENGREALKRLVALPLEAADLGNINVVVRYRDEARSDTERWDVSPSIADVLRNRRQERATE
jgi:type II secretory pathway pseudopilin PulG